MLASLFARDDHHKLGDLALLHPLVQLTHDFLDVAFDLVVRGNEHVETILLDWCEVFCWIDTSLEKNGVDAVLEEFGHGLC